ncbi:MAG: 6-pyruvoyl trahydropterin synthase family protein [Candidatus Hodarchaeales archaeon]|jgi:6-pyruvoyltetrahydropterin/6-carboxytetrahydropterin synthase
MATLEQKYSRLSNHFSACHFLIGFSKCDRLHGHDYLVKLKLMYQSEFVGHYFDFRTVNNLLNQIIKELDHKILLPGDSPSVNILPIRSGENWLVKVQGKEYSFPQKDVIILDEMEQTTCENIAEYLHRQITIKLNKADNFKAVSGLTVTLSETEGNQVSFSSKIV